MVVPEGRVHLGWVLWQQVTVMEVETSLTDPQAKQKEQIGNRAWF